MKYAKFDVCFYVQGDNPDFKWREWSKDFFGGLKFSILGFFWVGKFCKYLFWWLDLSTDFLGYSKQSEDSWYTVVPTYPGRVVLRIKQGGKLLVRGFFFFFGWGFWVAGLIEAIRIFFWFWFLHPFDHPRHLKSGAPLLGFDVDLRCLQNT